jgi:hypothetical protein
MGYENAIRTNGILWSTIVAFGILQIIVQTAFPLYNLVDGLNDKTFSNLGLLLLGDPFLQNVIHMWLRHRASTFCFLLDVIIWIYAHSSMGLFRECLLFAITGARKFLNIEPIPMQNNPEPPPPPLPENPKELVLGKCYSTGELAMFIDNNIGHNIDVVITLVGWTCSGKSSIMKALLDIPKYNDTSGIVINRFNAIETKEPVCAVFGNKHGEATGQIYSF